MFVLSFFTFIINCLICSIFGFGINNNNIDIDEIYENDNGYYIGVYMGKGADWDDAMIYCEDKIGTTLASIHTLTDHENAVNSIETLEKSPMSNNYFYAWIGANDFMTQNNFVWNDNTKFDYSNWHINEPSGNKNEDCVHITGPDNEAMTKWNDENCNAQLKAFICNRPSNRPNNPQS